VLIRDINLTASDAEWINSVYALVFASLLITVGRIGDIFDVAGCSSSASSFLASRASWRHLVLRDDVDRGAAFSRGSAGR